MNLIMIFGPQAVGKMTVGQELEKITGLKLFHNHMTIDLLSSDLLRKCGDYPVCSGWKCLKQLQNVIRMD